MSETIEYRDAIVTYLDILGFGDLVRKSNTDPSQAVVIHKLLHSLQQSVDIGWMVKIPFFFADNFSDTVIRTTFIASDAELHEFINVEIWKLVRIQAHLTTGDGILVRGGLARGKLYRDANGTFIFGPSLVRAYELAEHVAIYPCIVVDGEIAEMMEVDQKPMDQYIRRGDDGAHCIDYLNAEYKQGLAAFSHRDLQPLLKNHQKLAENKLEELSKKGDHLRQKALWLALYHNGTIERIMRHNLAMAEEYKSLFVAREKLFG